MAAPLAAVHHRRELRLLQLVGLALRPPPRRLHAVEPAARRPHLAKHGHVAEARAADPRAGGRPRSARLLQVLRLLRLLDGQPRHVRRDRPAALPEDDRPAGRHLVLHVHGDQLRRRRLPRRVPADDAREVRGVPLVLPPSRGRPDRAARRADPADRDPAGPAPRRHEPGLLPDRDGSLQEGRDRQLPRLVDRRPGVRDARAALVARDPRSPSTRTPSRSTRTSPATRTSRSGSRCCSDSRSRRTSTRRTRPSRCRTSGDAGT